MTKEQFLEITEWQKKTFGKATPLSKAIHLEQEVNELITDIKENNPERRLEFADCFILLCGAAASDGMTYDDICDCIGEKFGIIQKRDWGEPDKDGVVNHIKNTCDMPGCSKIAPIDDLFCVDHRY